MDFVKKYWPDCRVIVLTAYNNFQYAYDTLKYDKVDYILKIEGYEAICRTVEKDLELLDREEQLRDFYGGMDEKVSRLSSCLRSSIMDRLLNYGMTVRQEELDLLEIPLHIGEPVLLVAGSLYDCPMKEQLSQVAGILDYVEKSMAVRRIRAVFHNMNGKLLWLLQREEGEQEEKDAAVYIREIFSELSERVYDQFGKKLSFVADDRFVEASRLREIYERSILSLKESGAEGCLRMLRREQEDPENLQSMSELPFLLELLENGNTRELLDAVSEKMAGLSEIQDLRGKMPVPAVLMMETLLAEAQRLAGVREEDCERLVRSLYASAQQVPGAGWISEAIGLLEKLLAEGVRKKSANTTGLVQWINNYVEAHYTEDISLSAIAEKVNYNPSYLSRLYREQTGTTLVNHINLLRVNKAKRLLKETAMKTRDIAFASGFYSVRHFNQVFKKYTGASAGAWRQGITETVKK